MRGKRKVSRQKAFGVTEPDSNKPNCVDEAQVSAAQQRHQQHQSGKKGPLQRQQISKPTLPLHTSQRSSKSGCTATATALVYFIKASVCAWEVTANSAAPLQMHCCLAKYKVRCTRCRRRFDVRNEMQQQPAASASASWQRPRKRRSRLLAPVRAFFSFTKPDAPDYYAERSLASFLFSSKFQV